MSDTATLATATARSARLPVLKNRQTRATVAKVAVSDTALYSIAVVCSFGRYKYVKAMTHKDIYKKKIHSHLNVHIYFLEIVQDIV